MAGLGYAIAGGFAGFGEGLQNLADNMYKSAMAELDQEFRASEREKDRAYGRDTRLEGWARDDVLRADDRAYSEGREAQERARIDSGIERGAAAMLTPTTTLSDLETRGATEEEVAVWEDQNRRLAAFAADPSQSAEARKASQQILSTRLGNDPSLSGVTTVRQADGTEVLMGRNEETGEMRPYLGPDDQPVTQVPAPAKKRDLPVSTKNRIREWAEDNAAGGVDAETVADKFTLEVERAYNSGMTSTEAWQHVLGKAEQVESVTTGAGWFDGKKTTTRGGYTGNFVDDDAPASAGLGAPPDEAGPQPAGAASAADAPQGTARIPQIKTMTRDDLERLNLDFLSDAEANAVYERLQELNSGNS